MSGTDAIRLSDARRNRLVSLMTESRGRHRPPELSLTDAWRCRACGRWFALQKHELGSLTGSQAGNRAAMSAAVEAFATGIGVKKKVEVVHPAARPVRDRLMSGLYCGPDIYHSVESLGATLTAFLKMCGIWVPVLQRLSAITGLRDLLNRVFVEQAFGDDTPFDYPERNVIIEGRLKLVSAYSFSTLKVSHQLFMESMGEGGGNSPDWFREISAAGEPLARLQQAYGNGLGWLIETPTQILCIERPVVACDEQWRLHSESGTALRWPVLGVQEYWWHGVQVDRRLILEPEQFTVREILRTRNLEIRRVMIDRFGPERFLKEAGSEVLDSDLDRGGKRELVRIRPRSGEPLFYVKVRCPSTERIYLIRVPPSMRTCTEAIAWSFGLPTEQYLPLAES